MSWPGIVTINVCNYRFLWADNFLFNVVNQSKDKLKKRGANFYVSLLPLSSLISCENCFTVSLDDFSSFVNNSFSVSVDTKINVCNYRFLWADNFLFNVVNQSKDKLKKRGANFYVSLLPLSSLISCENCFTVSLDDFSSFVNNSFSVSVDT